MIPSLILLGLAGVFAGFVLTVLVRAKKLGDSWEDKGAVGDLRRVRSHHGCGRPGNRHR
jgi:hypothetical protein